MEVVQVQDGLVGVGAEPAANLASATIYLAEPSVSEPEELIKDTADADRVELDPGLGVSGAIFVQRHGPRTPDWASVLAEVARDPLPPITTHLAGAALVVRLAGRVFAFAFGQGRHLLRADRLVDDFGLRVLSKLAPAPGETLVLVAHHAGFDVGTVLRSELGRLKLEIPEVPVLDTAGRLSALAKVAVPGTGLDDLLDALELQIPASERHTALGDAMATARAVCALLDGAAAHGFSDINDLLKRAGSRLSSAIKASAPGAYRKVGAYIPEIPEIHAAAHFLLSPSPGKAELAGWISVADECARLSCPELAFSPASMVMTTDAEAITVIGALVEVVRRRAAAGDGVGTNAAAGAIAAAFGRWCPMPMPFGFTGRYPVGRRKTVKIGHEVMALADPLPRCSNLRACPWCIERRPCGRDEIVRAMAPAILDPKWVDGKITRQTTYNAWLHANDKGGWQFHRRDPGIVLPSSHTSKGGLPAGPRLADPAMALMVRAYAAWGEEPDRVARSRDALAKLLRRGCTDPAIHEMWARHLASPGRAADLDAAVAIAETQLEKRPEGTTDSGWTSLALYRDHLRGRLARLRDPIRLDKDGNAVRVPSHSAGPNPRRPPVFRFLRG